MFKKLLPVVLIAVSIVALACSGGDEISISDATQEEQQTNQPETDTQVSAESTDTATTETAAAEEEATTETAAAVSEPQEEAEEESFGGEFRRTWADPPTLDPHLTSDTTSMALVVEIYSGLVSLNTNLELEMEIAQDLEIDDTGTIYTFHLKPDAKFHDGKPVTAHDFKYSIERAAHPDLGSTVADTYLNDIVGSQDVFDGNTTDMAGVQVIDDLTLQITIDAPKAYFLAKLTYPTAYVLDQENVESGGRSWADTPNGTGPFKLTEYRIGERMILERNENYYKTKARLDRVIFNLAGGQTMAMYENDEIDFTDVGLFDIDRVLDPTEPLNSELIIAAPEFVISYIGFNTQEPPFDDRKFRQALNHAIDKELIATEVLSELAVPAYGILPPGFPGYNPNLKGLEFDPDLAKQLLAESKYAGPETRPRIVMTIPGTGGSPSLSLEVVLEMWRQTLGVEVEIQQIEWATYLKDLDAQKFQSFSGLGWEADYPDPQDFIDILFYSGSGTNHGAYANTEVDRLVVEARSEPDIARRVQLYQEAERLIVEDAAWVPMWFSGERYVLVKPHIKGYQMTPMIVPKLAQIYVDLGSDS